MPQESAQPVDGGGFHFKVSDPVLTITKIGEVVYQLGGGEAQAQDSALGAIEARTGNRDALVIAIGKMFEQGRGSCADIGG